MKKYLITGVSGTGKSTLARMFNEEGVHTIDIDSISGLCTWFNEDTKEVAHWKPGIGKDFFDEHDYVCDTEKLLNLMIEHEVVVVVGLADNQKSFLHIFDKVFLLQCDEKTFLNRIDQRDDNDFGKHQSEKEWILGWYKDIEKEMLTLGAISIDANQSTDVVYQELAKYFE